MLTIKQLCEKAHIQAITSGFWIPQESIVKGKIPKVRYRNIPELLMLIVSELGEACEALRHDKRQKDYVTIPSTGEKFKKTEWEKDTFEDEIADCFIRLADLCQALKIDIEWQISQKLAYNEKRPFKHGKKF